MLNVSVLYGVVRSVSVRGYADMHDLTKEELSYSNLFFTFM